MYNETFIYNEVNHEYDWPYLKYFRVLGNIYLKQIFCLSHRVSLNASL